MTALIASEPLAGISTFTIAVQQTAGSPEPSATDTEVQYTTEPRPINEINALEARVEGTPGAESSAVFIAEVPSGSPAEAAIVDVVTDVSRELVACLRSGELLRTYALYTDTYLAAIAGSNGSLIDSLPSTPATDDRSIKSCTSRHRHSPSTISQ